MIYNKLKIPVYRRSMYNDMYKDNCIDYYKGNNNKFKDITRNVFRNKLYIGYFGIKLFVYYKQ